MTICVWFFQVVGKDNDLHAVGTMSKTTSQGDSAVENVCRNGEGTNPFAGLEPTGFKSKFAAMRADKVF
jgi:hypothetical protein